MERSARGEALSTRDYDALAQAAGRIVQTSEGAGWQGLLVRSFEHTSDGRLTIPEVVEDALIIVTNYVVEAEGKVVQRFRGCRPVPGDIFVVPRGVPSEWQWRGQCNVTQLSPDPALVTRMAVEALDVEPSRVELVPRITYPDPLVHEIGRALLAELQSAERGSRLYVDLLTQTLVVHLLRTHAARPAEPRRAAGGLSPAALRRVTEYVLEHLPEELRLAKLAGVANLSPYHFARLFRQSLGLSVHSYVMERRLERASQLLAEGLTLAEVAARTGFADQSHLSRRYRARFGVSPRAHVQQRTQRQEDSTKIQAGDDRDE